MFSFPVHPIFHSLITHCGDFSTVGQAQWNQTLAKLKRARIWIRMETSIQGYNGAICPKWFYRAATKKSEANVVMFQLKGCPRCAGDLFQDQDQYGFFVGCMQCGLSREVSNQPGEPVLITADPIPPPPLPQIQGKRQRRVSHGGRHYSKTFDFREGSPAQSAA